jgi:DNA-damage-inducible protein D
MPDDKKTIEPIEAGFDEVAKAMVNNAPTDIDGAVARFGQLTRQEAIEEGKTGDLVAEGETQLVLFRGAQIRQVCHNDEWHFAVVDVIGAVTDSSNPRRYWSDLKSKMAENEGFNELYEEIVQLPFPAADGKMYKSDACNTETLFRIIQSVPSPKAEPFKKWLAKVGYERIQEIQDPEIAIKRALMTYKAKGYSDEWINARVQTIASRKELTREWQKRGINEGMEYALLTDAISRETFGLTTKDHKTIKSLKKNHNLRDHMSPLELALTMLGETTTAELARTTNAQGFRANEEAAKLGGKVAGGARKNIEQKIGRSVVSRDNHLPAPQPKFPAQKPIKKGEE